MKTDNLKAGARWLVLIVFASAWVEVIQTHLLWIFITFLIAGLITMILEFRLEFWKQKLEQAKRDLAPYLDDDDDDQ